MSLSLGTHEVMLDGVRQRYHVAGSGPVCVVHSGGPGLHWEYLRLPSLEEHLTLVYVEPVGTGESGLLPDGDYSVSRYAWFARRVIGHLGDAPVYFLGHSHGAFVGLQLALDHPEVLAGLILYEGTPVFGPDLRAETDRTVAAWAALRPGHPEVVQVLEARSMFEVTDTASFLAYLGGMLPIYFADFGRMDLDAWLETLDGTLDPRRLATQWDVRGLLSGVQVPTLVVVGAYDFICGVRWARELADGIPGASLVTLEHSGHFGHLEEPAEFFRAVLAFCGFE
jgi:proline iminopeptidase